MPLNLCLDLGTAYSKAAAWTKNTNRPVPLRLGEAVGWSGYTLPTTVLVTTDSRVCFGERAVAERRRRKLLEFSELKHYLTRRCDPLDTVWLPDEYNPSSIPLTMRQVTSLYFAFLSHAARKSLRNRDVEQRTLTMPVFKGKQDAHLRHELRLAAQHGWKISSDLQDELEGELDLRVALRRLQELERESSVKRRSSPECLEFVEPLAAIAARMATYDPAFEKGRRLSMVIDVGAGTVDFGMFVSGLQEEEIGVYPVAEAKYSLPVGGNDIDNALVEYILEKADLYGERRAEIEAILREDARYLKENLLEEGEDTPVWFPDAGVELTKKEFLRSNQLRLIGKQIDGAFWDRFRSVDRSWLNFAHGLHRTGISIFLSGGGAKLPFLRKMIPKNAPQTVDGSPQFYFRVAEDDPSWASEGKFRRAWQQVGRDYPQMAVSLGGAVFGAEVNQFLKMGTGLERWGGAM